jgi:signal transduction histidine kinase
MSADPGAPLRVLLIEDNPGDELLVQRALAQVSRTRFLVTTAPTLTEGLAQLEAGGYDALLLDLALPGSGGLETLQGVRQRAAAIPIVVLSGLEDEALAIASLAAGAQDFLVKGQYAPTQLGRALRYAVERKRAQDEADAVNQRLKTRVRHRTKKLEVATEELQSFIHGITHDLRTPLRSIHGFSELLLEEYGDRLDDTGHDYLRRLVVASERLETLLNALQTLAQLNRTTLRWERVSLTHLAELAAEEQVRRWPDHPVSVSIDPDLCAVGDPRLLRMALGHLLSNAWKFSRGVESPTVTFGQTEGTFFMRDNGVGFDMAFSSHLFKPFQRLHADEEFEGTGMGLATASRIIHRHGGRLWAESAPGEGATFFFFLESRLPGEPLL